MAQRNIRRIHSACLLQHRQGELGFGADTTLSHRPANITQLVHVELITELAFIMALPWISK